MFRMLRRHGEDPSGHCYCQKRSQALPPAVVSKFVHRMHVSQTSQVLRDCKSHHERRFSIEVKRCSADSAANMPKAQRNFSSRMHVLMHPQTERHSKEAYYPACSMLSPTKRHENDQTLNDLRQVPAEHRAVHSQQRRLLDERCSPEFGHCNIAENSFFISTIKSSSETDVSVELPTFCVTPYCKRTAITST